MKLCIWVWESVKGSLQAQQTVPGVTECSPPLEGKLHEGRDFSYLLMYLKCLEHCLTLFSKRHQ